MNPATNAIGTQGAEKIESLDFFLLTLLWRFEKLALHTEYNRIK
jgi:hypothetical protein